MKSIRFHLQILIFYHRDCRRGFSIYLNDWCYSYYYDKASNV